MIPQCSKILENLVQHCNIIMWKWPHIWCHQKCCLQQRRTFKKSFSNGKHDTASQLL